MNVLSLLIIIDYLLMSRKFAILFVCIYGCCIVPFKQKPVIESPNHFIQPQRNGIERKKAKEHTIRHVVAQIAQAGRHQQGIV